MFFEAIRTLVPEVFAELAPMINSAWIDDGKIWPHMLRDRDYEVDVDPRVEAWASRRGLSDRHSLTIVKASLYGWATGNLSRGVWQVGLWAPEPLYPPLDYPIWNPRWESETAFRARVDAYIQSVAGGEYARGAELTPVKRGRPSEPIERHFEWLALYAVGGLTLEDISQRYPVGATDAPLTRQAIQQGIATSARLAGVTLRSPVNIQTQS